MGFQSQYQNLNLNIGQFKLILISFN